MTSPKHGTSTSKLEVTNISEHGFGLSHGTHLHWPDLDVDRTFNIIEHPDHYKHVSK